MEKKKKVLLVTQYFYPESFKSNDIAFELVKRGYEVDALVSIPNYPEGKFYKGYGIFRKRIEIINGVNVYRAFQVPRGKGGLRLPLTYFSFVVSASLWVLFKFAWKKYDCIICHETSPIFQAYPGLLLKKIRKVPFYMWVLDIWPDAMRSGGGIKNEKVINFVDKRVKRIYKHCDKILISSRRFTESILPKGNFADKIVYFPNWSEDMLAMRQDYEIPSLPEGFKIMIAGNLGKSQNLDAVAEAMLSLKDTPEVKWLFVGDGSRKQWLDDFIKENELGHNAFTYGRYPFAAMPAFYKAADAMLVTLRGGFPHLEMVVPARLQSYMSAGKPVLAMIGSGGADIIKEADCGYAVPAGDAPKLVKIIKEMVLTDKISFEKKGENGRKYFEQNYQIKDCIDNLEKLISE